MSRPETTSTSELSVAAQRVHFDEDLAAPPTTLRRWLYRIVDAVLVSTGRLLLSVRVEGLDNVPTTGPFILAPVHRSNLDFALVLACARDRKGRMRYLAKDTLWRWPFGRLWTALGAIPVHRGTPDRDAFEVCVRVLLAGEPLVIFPEGTRQSGPVVQELFDGVAYIQAKTGVPIIPVGIGGSEAAMPRGAKVIHRTRVVLCVGNPLEAPEPAESGRVRRSAVRDQTRSLHAELQRLFDRACRQTTSGG